jgi:uncharacterized protein YggE
MKALFFATAALLMSATGTVAAAQDSLPGAAAAAAADTMFRATTLNLASYGEVKAAPDTATVSLGVQVQAKTAAAAMAQNAEQMNRVVDALKRAGIPARNIQTSGLSLSTQYAYADNQPPRLTGYQAANTVTVNVDDISRLGAPLDAVVGAGANQINGIEFGLRDPQKAEDQARLIAVKALQAKAQLYAQATGYRVSRLVNLAEGSSIAAPPQPMVMSMARRAEKATPVEAGQLTVRVDVSGLYELAR